MENLLTMPKPTPKIRVRKFGNQGWEVLVPRYFWMPSERIVYASGQIAVTVARKIADIRTETIMGEVRKVEK